jgi:hypothetical protein
MMNLAGRGNGDASVNRMKEFLAKADDISMSRAQSPVGLETISLINHPASGKSYQNWNTTHGTFTFPEGRDPVDLASVFNVKDDGDEDSMRDQIIARAIDQENKFMRLVGTEREQEAAQIFQQHMGYLPLTYRRIIHAREILGNGNE